MQTRTTLLNPFYIHAAVWTVVLALYALGWSQIYNPLAPGLAGFLIATIVAALVLGRAIAPRLATAATQPDRPGLLHRHSRLITALLVAGVLLEFAVAGQIPFLALLTTSGFRYGEFPGIPMLHVGLVTFSIFFMAYLADQLTKAPRGSRLAFGVQYLALLSMFVLMLNRGAMVLGAFMLAIIFLSRARLTLRRILATAVFGIVTLYAFGCLGNLRFGLSWADNSYILSISGLSSTFPSWLPGQFAWTYMYLVSPLGNVNELVHNYPPAFDLGASVINLLPDFFAKRAFPEFDPSTPLVVPYYTVSSGWASAWQFNGYIGLVVMFLALVTIVLIAVHLVRNSLQVSAWAVTSGVVAFMFFTNAISYSGVSFALAYPVLSALVKRPSRDRRAPHRPPALSRDRSRSVTRVAPPGADPAR